MALSCPKVWEGREHSHGANSIPYIPKLPFGRDSVQRVWPEERKELGLWVKRLGSRLAPPHSGCVTLGKYPPLSGPDISLQGGAGLDACQRQLSGRRAGSGLQPSAARTAPSLTWASVSSSGDWGWPFSPTHRMKLRGDDRVERETLGLATREVGKGPSGCLGLWGGRNGRLQA